jgi:hypothetical protein
MGFRLRASGIHLLASFGLLTLVLLSLYAGWYRWPGWYLLGAETVVGVLILVDLGLGPLATLVVSNPAKARPEWRRDVALIVLVQLLALGYGTHALWVGRPLFYVFSLDRIEVVPSAVFQDDTVESARLQNARILPKWHTLPQWIWAPLPDSPEERDRIIASAISGGDDVVALPQYFRPWAEGQAALRERLLPMSGLASLETMSEADYRVRMAELGLPETRLGALPARGTRRDGVWIFDRERGKPLAFWPVEMWSLVK